MHKGVSQSEVNSDQRCNPDPEQSPDIRVRDGTDRSRACSPTTGRLTVPLVTPRPLGARDRKVAPQVTLRSQGHDAGPQATSRR